ncbi:MAG: hypothetical protein BWY98_00604 [Tenericutes bacterium ADurb.BinA155]|nr:MAG: hypothetical protein BWY98_00604 [Tenericutes bacterium ADurb.BinA155]
MKKQGIALLMTLALLGSLSGCSFSLSSFSSSSGTASSSGGGVSSSSSDSSSSSSSSSASTSSSESSSSNSSEGGSSSGSSGSSSSSSSSEPVKRFTITFANWDGAELQKSDWDYGSTPSYTGSTPTKAEDTDCAYTFSGWNPAIVEVTGVATYTATFAGKKKLLFTLAADGKSYSVSGRNTIDPVIVIPSEYNGLPVTTIGDYAFKGFAALTSITIPDSVTSIGNYAFFGCTGLTSVTIPDSVTSIGWGAFFCCSALTSVTIPSSVTSIGVRAFSGCKGLASIIVDSANPNYQSIDGVLFSKDGKTLIAYPAGKSGSAYVIPSSVTSVGWCAFFGCTGLTSVTIPSSVTNVSYGAFYGCTGCAIYCEATSRPTDWDYHWNDYGGTAYWYSETSKTGCWHYVNGVPTLW